MVRCGEWDTQTEGEPLDHQVNIIDDQEDDQHRQDYFWRSSGKALISKMINIAKIILPFKMDMIVITQYEKSKIIYGLYIGLHWIDGDHSNKIPDCFRIVQSTTLSATLSSTLAILVNLPK